MNSPRLLLTISETASALGLSRVALYRAIATGRFPLEPVRITSRPGYSVREIERWLDAGAPDRAAWIAMKLPSRSGGDAEKPTKQAISEDRPQVQLSAGGVQ